LSQRYRMSSASSTCRRAASSAASSGRFELVPSCSLPTRMHPAISLRCRQQNPHPLDLRHLTRRLLAPHLGSYTPPHACFRAHPEIMFPSPFSATLHSSFLASLHMASSIICLCPSLPALAWTQHDIGHGLGLALTSPRFHHPFHLHELPPFFVSRPFHHLPPSSPSL
jgi:hypothetical protein